MQFQRSRGLSGDLLEIGVYHGKYFVELCQELGDREMAVAIDIFESADPTIEGSAQGSREAFEEALKTYAPQTTVYVMERDSADLEPVDILEASGSTDPAPFRFVSIDGSHDYAHVYHDLRLASALLVPGGIIALDDWSPTGNQQWPEVGAAEMDFLHDGKRANPVFHIGVIPNKLLLTNTPAWVTEYQQVLRDWVKDHEDELS